MAGRPGGGSNERVSRFGLVRPDLSYLRPPSDFPDFFSGFPRFFRGMSGFVYLFSAHLKGPTRNIPDFQFSAYCCRISITLFREAPDTLTFLRHVMRAVCLSDQSALIDASRNETALKPVQILTHATRRSTEQTSVRTKRFRHIAI